MLNAIGSASSNRTAAPPLGGLEAQLTRYRQQLSDCVNCASTSNTPEGRETARSLSDKISQIKAQLDAVSTASTPAFNPSAAAGSGAQGSANPNEQPNSTTATLGNYLNVFA